MFSYYHLYIPSSVDTNFLFILIMELIRQIRKMCILGNLAIGRIRISKVLPHMPLGSDILIIKPSPISLLSLSPCEKDGPASFEFPSYLAWRDLVISLISKPIFWFIKSRPFPFCISSLLSSCYIFTQFLFLNNSFNSFFEISILCF